MGEQYGLAVTGKVLAISEPKQFDFGKIITIGLFTGGVHGVEVSMNEAEFVKVQPKIDQVITLPVFVKAKGDRAFYRMRSK